jgi:hypothetical protein
MNGGTLKVDLEGTTPGTNYDQVAVTGTVTLTNPTLQINMTAALPAPGQTFTIIANDGSDPVVGIFTGKAEGSQFNTGGADFRITYSGADGNDVVLTALATTSTSLLSSKNPTVSGEPFTLTATVTSSFGTPGGLVRFLEGAAVLATAALDGSGVATAVVQLTAGPHAIVAEYQGAGMFRLSTSSALTHNAGQGSTSVMLSFGANPVVHGQSLVLTAAASAIPPATGTPSGTITLTVDGNSASGSLDGSGQFSQMLSLQPGIHTLSAAYGGNANFVGTTTSDSVEVFATVAIADTEATNATTNTIAEVVVTLSAASNQPVRIDYMTVDDTARAGTDYVTATGTLEFAPGETTKTITISILGDQILEVPETLRVMLSNPQHAVLANTEATVNITDSQDIPTLGPLALILCVLLLATVGLLAVKAA